MEITPDEQNDDSDYGSDFAPDEEEILNELLQRMPNVSPSSPSLVVADIEDDEPPCGARIAQRFCKSKQDGGNLLLQSEGNMDNNGSKKWDLFSRAEVPGKMERIKNKNLFTTEIAVDGYSPSNMQSQESRTERQMAVEHSVAIETPVDNTTSAEPGQADLRSPLKRFRSKPKKALSVTDLVSPSWCEMQYWYTLTKHGKKRRTPAMKQGSAIHKVLEEQVHRTVAVDIQKKEDAWGLRIWNVIQSLKTLRETGMTRELEVWGIVDGLVVNGVIDELNYTCPDAELEAQREKAVTSTVPSALLANQKTITDFLSPRGSNDLSAALQGVSSPSQPADAPSKSHHRVYLTDTKTRSSPSIPKGTSLRPTYLQLMLYHRLLSDLSTGKVDPNVLFARYELDGRTSFTDEFVAQISEIFYDVYESDEADEAAAQPSTDTNVRLSEPPAQDQSALQLLLAHNSLHQLWNLMLAELRTTFPAGKQSIGNVLKAEYRSATGGEILGQRTFLMDDEMISSYLDDGLKWWRGERETKGVVVEEAYKCGFCEFAEGCDWRKGKIEEAKERMRLGNERRKSTV